VVLVPISPLPCVPAIHGDMAQSKIAQGFQRQGAGFTAEDFHFFSISA
jgi:hypothetical protein